MKALPGSVRLSPNTNRSEYGDCAYAAEDSVKSDASASRQRRAQLATMSTFPVRSTTGLVHRDSVAVRGSPLCAAELADACKQTSKSFARFCALGVVSLVLLSSRARLGSHCIARDEIGHAPDALLDRLIGRGIAEADVLPFVRHARPEMNVGEHRHARLVEQTRTQLLGVARTDHAAGLGHIRPHVKCTARRAASHTWHLVEQLHDEISPLEENIAHLLRCVLRPRKCFHPGPLADLRCARFGVGHPVGEVRRELAIGGEA